MKLDPRQYDEMVNRASPPSPVVRDCAWAFLVGGAICTLGEALRQFFLIWYDKTLAGTLTSIALIFLSAIFTLPPRRARGRWCPLQGLQTPSSARRLNSRPRAG